MTALTVVRLEPSGLLFIIFSRLSDYNSDRVDFLEDLESQNECEKITSTILATTVL